MCDLVDKMTAPELLRTGSSEGTLDENLAAQRDFVATYREMALIAPNPQAAADLDAVAGNIQAMVEVLENAVALRDGGAAAGDVTEYIETELDAILSDEPAATEGRAASERVAALWRSLGCI